MKCPGNSRRLHTFLNLGGSRSIKWPHCPARAQLRRGLRKVRTETSLEMAVARHSAGLASGRRTLRVALGPSVRGAASRSRASPEAAVPGREGPAGAEPGHS